MDVVPFESELWAWRGAAPTPTEHLGRECLLVESGDTGGLATVAGVELVDGVIEVELAVGSERAFHGLVWRLRDDDNYESFYVRPHQMGNPDAVQYTPVFNGVSGWQLYHGPGYWAPVSFPLDEWFRIRVAFSGTRAEAYVGDMEVPALEIQELKGPVEPGAVGVLVGGPGLHLAGFAFDPAAGVGLRRPAPSPAPPVDGIVPGWWVSDAFPEDALAGAPVLDEALVAARTWSRLESEPTGLADLARVNGVRDGSNTALARATIRAARARTARLELGFSDRAVVYLNGRALYRGNDTYRSRDYRFLGSIGYYDALYLPLEEGENELVVAVSETFGGWGVQARFADLTDLSFA